MKGKKSFIITSSVEFLVSMVLIFFLFTFLFSYSNNNNNFVENNKVDSNYFYTNVFESFLKIKLTDEDCNLVFENQNFKCEVIDLVFILNEDNENIVKPILKKYVEENLNTFLEEKHLKLNPFENYHKNLDELNEKILTDYIIVKNLENENSDNIFSDFFKVEPSQKSILDSYVLLYKDKIIHRVGSHTK